MKVGILIPTLADGDAVGNDAIGMAKHLRGRGLGVTFFTMRNATNEPSLPMEELAPTFTDPEDVLICHHSIGYEAAVREMERTVCRRKAVKYHNVTPPRFFEKLNPAVAHGCQEGIDQVARLADTSAHFWSDSKYNGEHMQEFRPGRPFSEIAPFHQADDLLQLEPDYRAAMGLDDWATNILLVGRVVPNKNVPLAVEAFAEYRRLYDPRARLVIAGDQPIPEHAAEVRSAIEKLGQSGHAIITGKVSTAQLKALYLTADALLVTSFHEGFCVPLIEAMGLRVPVVAVSNAAVPGTGGDAALYAEADPIAIAEKLNEVVSNAAGREQQIDRGWNRYESRFSNKAIENRFAHLFDELLKA